MGKKSDQRVQPELSYVLPTFNRCEYLGECILSLEEQNYPRNKYEIIVVDDGSEDSTVELMEHFVAEYKNISFYKLNHVGVEEARNYGNQIAHAPIIGVCDSDDLYHEDRTKLTLEYFKKNPDIDIMNGSYWEINHAGFPVKYYQAIELNQKEFMNGKQAYFCHDNCAYKTERILKTPYKKEGGQTDDWKLVHDFIEAKYKFGFLDKELCKVRTLRIGIMGERRQKRGIKLAHA